MVGLSSTSQPGVLHWAGSSPLQVVGPKSSSFPWQPGDTLRYLGYASDTIGPLSAFIEDDPMSSATELFQLARGLVCPDSPSVTDIDGNTYGTVKIGSQCWMAENLKTTRYRDGISIPNVTDNTTWAQLNTGAWCDHGNNAANDTIHGKLYNWYAAADPNICPQGWHVPTDAEWHQLEQFLGIPSAELNSLGFRGAAQNAGGEMKATTLWNAPNLGATDGSGFSGLPGGLRYGGYGHFDGLGGNGYWWSASESSAASAWFRFLYFNNAGVYRSGYSKRFGFCVRCVRD
ncbi:MAG: fibrobacter succinogenes major paralogous domain-containing protein [Flavobacteriales bacterium]|nr:fibrobacter succinogenes major paralogous domain-containing protein [Flavobacteriales bacterium]